MRLVHIFHDDKFVDSTIKLFDEVRSDISIYFVLKNKKAPLNYVKSDQVQRLDVNQKDQFQDFIKKMNSIPNTVLMLHTLSSEHQHIVSKVNDSLKKVWFVWGYDLYDTWPLYKKSILTKRTREFAELYLTFSQRMLFNSFGLFLFKIRALFPSKFKHKLESSFNLSFFENVQKIDYVTTVVPNEYELVKGLNSTIKYLPFSYASIESLMADDMSIDLNEGVNILVGNSADPSNNHIDILEKLSSLELGERKVYVPLSYSGNDTYIRKIQEAGFKLLPKNFVPILKYLTLEEYNKILSSCSVFIFNHIRQQALGNIIFAGYSGAKLYLNPKSPVYQYLSSENIKLYSTDSISNRSLNSAENLNGNKELFYQLYSKEVVKNKVETLINTLEDA